MLRPFLILFLALGAVLATAGDIPLAGPGINTHGQCLPIDALRAIGINWVRIDLPPAQVKPDLVKKIKAWYKDFPQLWIVSQSSPNAPSEALLYLDCGITDLECGNEPAEAKFSADNKAWSAERYGKWFKTIRTAVGTRMRLYGPATGTWDPGFISGAIAAGMQADCITWHGYWRTVEQMASTFAECQSRFGLPSVCSEEGTSSIFPSTYPVRIPCASLYVQLKTKLGNLPWCYYDGCNGNEDKTVGLFDTADHAATWTRPTQTYRDILRLLNGGHQATYVDRHPADENHASSSQPAWRKSVLVQHRFPRQL